MRSVRFLLPLLLLSALLMTGCTSEPERVWASFVDAVSEKRVDEALGYIDFERMAQKAVGDDAESALALGLLGGTEGVGKMMEGLLRDALSKGEIQEGKPALELKKPKKVTAEGDYCTMLFIGSDGGDMTVEMERIDGEWKIVGIE
ncbi:MAG: hypothetical protein Q8K99_05665 [Actinomycetota bacterium]|nr:hypothetical protein [Actinomycetota bacterium]